MTLTNVSSKGQIVIPKDMREEYGLKPGSKVSLLSHHDGILLKPIPRKLGTRLRGLFKKSGLVTDLEAEHRWEIERDAKRESKRK